MSKLLIIICILFFTGSSFAQDSSSANAGKPQTNASSNAIEYEVFISFYNKEQLDKDTLSELEQLMLQVSESHRLQEKPPLSTIIISRRGEKDVVALQKALRSRGYYNSKVDYRMDSSKKPVSLTFRIDTGAVYLLDTVALILAEPEKQQNSQDIRIKLPTAKDLQLGKGEKADARSIVKAEKLIINELKQQSYAYAKIVDKKFTVDHKKQTMQIGYIINSGPAIRFGKVSFTGMESVDSDYLYTLIGWKDNDKYHPDLIKETTRNIAGSNLFSTIRVELDKKVKILPATSQTIPVLITLKERLHRSVKTSIGFDTDTGFSVGGKWTHRNYFGAGEKLSVEAAWTGVGPLLDVRFTKPSFYSPKQSFISNITLKNEETDAYDSTSFSMGVGVERRLKKNMSASLGVGFRHSQITDKSISENNQTTDSSENFSLLYLPMKFNWDFSNDLFEPSGGGKFLVQGAPYMDVQSDLAFGKLYASYVHYLKVLSKPKIVLAGRTAFGKIMGAEASELPADERLYSGGGGSVRGFAYQKIGPLDKYNNPLGGNALLEFALESRINITESIGAVVFVDAGSAFSSDFFDGSSDLLYGSGIGFRYSSPMGPLRADIAIPVNPRDGVDDSFQIYLSIGQAF